MSLFVPDLPHLDRIMLILSISFLSQAVIFHPQAAFVMQTLANAVAENFSVY